MKDLLTKTMLAGIGLAAISKDKLEEFAKDLIEKGNLTEQEGRKFVKEISGYAEKTKGELEKQVNKYVEKALDRMDLVRKSEIEELIRMDLIRKSELEELRATILELQIRLEKDKE
jgi:polyhydroxyalkanoate synthesis regulator phasin